MSNHRFFVIASAFVFVFLTTATAVVSQQIVGSDRHCSILCVDQAVFSWGDNQDGLLGDGTTTSRGEAVRTLLAATTSIHGSALGTVAIENDGDVFAWGGVVNNQYGIPSLDWIEPTPIAISHVAGVRKVVVNSGNAYYLLYDGRVKVSGMNWKGQHGNGSTTRIDSGSVFVSIDSVVEIFSAASTAFAVRSDGSVWGWGTNEWNHIDSSSEPFYLLPKKILQTNGVVASCGTFGGVPYNLGSLRIVTVDGDVWVWGQNDKNQLGLADTKSVKIPTKIAMPGKVIAISGGVNHSLVLLENGTVWTWGDNGFGQLGNPYYNNTVEPVKAIGLANVVAIGSGSLSSYAIMRDGSLHGWGDNTYRQLNRDDAPRQYTAVPLPVPCGLVSGVAVDDQRTTSQSSPSPVIDILTVPIAEGTTRVEIFSIEGRTVHVVQPSLTDSMVRFDLSFESPGLYTVVRTRGNVVTTEVVIKY